jgi:hypothetical protein
MCCNKDYKQLKKKDVISKNLNDYVRYIGCCNEDCFKKLDRKKRNRLMLEGFIYYNKK